MKIDSINSYRRDSVITKWALVAVMGLSILTNVIMYWSNINFLEREKSKKIVIDKDNNELLATERVMTLIDRKYQYEDHVKDFYKLFFEFDHSENNFVERTELALQLGGASVEAYYKELYVDNGYEQKIRENNWEFKIDIEKVEVNMDTFPRTGYIIAKQTLIRPTGKSIRNMNSVFTIRDVHTSPMNPHGAFIDNWVITDKTRIKQENEK